MQFLPSFPEFALGAQLTLSQFAEKPKIAFALFQKVIDFSFAHFCMG
jgi:hypothetical protein